MNRNKAVIIIVLVGIVIGIVLYFFNVQSFLFGGANNVNGNYVQLVGAFIGGCIVIYGLFINNKRVEEQIRQNNLSEKSLISNRFKDASTLLGSDKKTTLLAGVYSLHQIATESNASNDKANYVKIVHTLLVELIKDLSLTDPYDEKIMLILLDLVFSKESIYQQFPSSLNGCRFYNIDFSNLNIDNVSFDNSTINNALFRTMNMSNVSFKNVILSNSDFSNSQLKSIDFSKSTLDTNAFNNANVKKILFCDCNH